MKKLGLILSALSIFTGSFLLFLVQPMIGNIMLPHFGGTAAVWIVCLSTFQVLLIAGYAYAHFLSGRLRVSVHVVLLLLAAALLVPAVDFATARADAFSGSDPTAAIIAFLLLTVALPYVLVGANATLVQSIAAKGKGGYRLYALSNAGSFVGLLSYPLVIEPLLTLGQQLRFYAVGTAAYAVLLAGLVALLGSGERTARRSRLLPSFADRAETLPWFLLSALSCFLLDAVSSHLCLDVSPLPLLWCVILAVYLLTWVLAFTDRGSKVGSWLSPLVLAATVYAMYNVGRSDEISYVDELTTGLSLLFFGAWFVHARLYAIRPGVEKLTRYYFMISIGGAVGGVAASIVSPLVFSFVAEYPLAQTALFALVLLFFADVARRLAPAAVRRVPDLATLRLPPRAVPCAILALTVVAGVWTLSRTTIMDGVLIHRCRNFYGTIRLKLLGPETHHMEGVKTCLAMDNNGTVHGMQVADGAWRGFSASTYFTELGGGQSIVEHPLRKAGKPIRAAILGMGIGSLVGHSKRGDFFRFFEINPNVADLARDKRYFTMLKSADATVEVVVDDARKALERERAANEEKYDLLVVDVFSGDSIPAHLATKEAMALYLDRLKEDGILAFHLSNWHLNLSPVVKALSDSFGLHKFGVLSMPTKISFAAYWMYMSRKPIPFSCKKGVQYEVNYDAVEDVPALKDDFHPLIRYIEINTTPPLKK